MEIVIFFKGLFISNEPGQQTEYILAFPFFDVFNILDVSYLRNIW